MVMVMMWLVGMYSTRFRSNRPPQVSGGIHYSNLDWNRHDSICVSYFSSYTRVTAVGSTDVIALEFQSFVFNLKSGGSITGTICDILYFIIMHHHFPDPTIVTDNVTKWGHKWDGICYEWHENGVPAGQNNKTFQKLAEENDEPRTHTSCCCSQASKLH